MSVVLDLAQRAAVERWVRDIWLSGDPTEADPEQLAAHAHWLARSRRLLLAIDAAPGAPAIITERYPCLLLLMASREANEHFAQRGHGSKEQRVAWREIASQLEGELFPVAGFACMVELHDLAVRSLAAIRRDDPCRTAIAHVEAEVGRFVADVEAAPAP